MIVLINGPFGIGKTTAATLLVQRLPGSMLYDPEPLGSFVRTTVGHLDPVADYQDFPLWRALVVETARLLRQAYPGPIVIPMTIWRRDYFDPITEGLRRIDPAFVCLRLTASESTLRARILARPDADGPHDWCLRHLERGLAAARDPAFGIEVPTDGASPDAVCDAILQILKDQAHL